MRVLVCGGRSFSDREKLYLVLDELHVEKGTSLIIHGAQRGADSLAACWGYDRKISVMAFPAEWSRYGDAAGPIRNSQMLRIGQPQIVVAFAGNKGTRGMVKKARGTEGRGCEVREIE